MKQFCFILCFSSCFGYSENSGHQEPIPDDRCFYYDYYLYVNPINFHDAAVRLRNIFTSLQIPL